MTTKQVFTFKEGKYSIDILRPQLRNSPKICIKSEDLDVNFKTAVELPEGFDDSRELVALYQYDGKYFVLLGMKKITTLLTPKKDDEGDEYIPSVNISGYLVTKHTLKKAQVVDASPEQMTQRVQEYTAAPRDRRGDRGEQTPYRRNHQQRAGQRCW